MIVSRFKQWKGTAKKIEDEGKVIKSFKFDIEALQDRAQEWIIEVQQKMDGLTAGNIIPTLELDTATCGTGRTIHVMNSNKCTNTLIS